MTLKKQDMRTSVRYVMDTIERFIETSGPEAVYVLKDDFQGLGYFLTVFFETGLNIFSDGFSGVRCIRDDDPLLIGIVKGCEIRTESKWGYDSSGNHFRKIYEKSSDGGITFIIDPNKGVKESQCNIPHLYIAPIGCTSPIDWSKSPLIQIPSDNVIKGIEFDSKEAARESLQQWFDYCLRTEMYERLRTITDEAARRGVELSLP
jgi:hypothetical protein